MNKSLISLTAMLALAVPVAAQEEPEGAPSPNEIVEQAAPEEWIAITAEDLLVMTLAPDEQGNPREVVIQLMPAPFSQGWTENIRTLARARWYDDITVNRVQDNYVVQWGDINYDNPEAEGAAKPLPDGLRVMDQSEYLATKQVGTTVRQLREFWENYRQANGLTQKDVGRTSHDQGHKITDDAYAWRWAFYEGWPYATSPDHAWPVHCYGMVGVGRGYSPDTGSGAELYTVIGHAPRHLDRNIALVGRIVGGVEHLSSLPRGTGALGFYAAEEADKRTPILSVRVASDLPEGGRPAFEYLSTEGETFARYADARANRRDPFFVAPADGADICNIPVPVRRSGE